MAVALFLLFRIPLIATFRAALILLAALEVLAFGRRLLSTGAGVVAWAGIVVKLAILGAAYIALSG